MKSGDDMKELIFDIQRHRDATDVLYRGNRRWSGNFGRIWIEGSLIFDIEAFECKVTMDREDVIIGQSKDSKIVGLTGEGTITVKRVFDSGIKAYWESIKAGHDVRFTLDAAIQDPDMVNGQEQRIHIENLWFNDFSPLHFTKGEVVTDELNFGFTSEDLTFPKIVEA